MVRGVSLDFWRHLRLQPRLGRLDLHFASGRGLHLFRRLPFVLQIHCGTAREDIKAWRCSSVAGTPLSARTTDMLFSLSDQPLLVWLVQQRVCSLDVGLVLSYPLLQETYVLLSVPCLAAVVYSPALESLFLGFLVYLPTTYPKCRQTYMLHLKDQKQIRLTTSLLADAASVLASNGLARAAAAAAFPLFGRTMYSKLTIGGGCSLLGGLSILFIPPLAFLYFQGYKLRRLSKYAAQPPETIHF